MFKNELKQLGFSKNETIIYLSLFELGKVRASKIIESTSLHRNIVYTSLEELIKRELVTKTTVEGVAEFVANDPRNLLVEVERKKQMAGELVEKLKKMQEEPREITVYEGFEGVKRSRNKVFDYKKGDELCVLGASTLSSTPEYEKYWKKFHSKRISLGIGLKILYEYGIDKEDIEWRRDLPNTEIKYLPPGLDSPVWFSAIGSNLEIGVPGDSPLVFNIRSKGAADAVKKYFDYLWNQDTVVVTGFEKFGKILEESLYTIGKKDKTYDVLGAGFGPPNHEKRYEDFFADFHRKRIKEGVQVRLLFQQGTEERVIANKQFYNTFAEARYLPYRTQSPVATFVFSERIILLIQRPEPVAIVIKDVDVAKTYKRHFENLWNQEVRTYSGWEEVEKFFLNELVNNLNPGDKEYVIGAGYGESEDSQRFDDLFLKHNGWLIKNKIEKRALFYEKHRERFESEVKKLGDPFFKLVKIRYLPDEFYSPVETHITDSKCSITYFGDNPVATLYTNSGIISGFKKRFELMWNMAKE